MSLFTKYIKQRRRIISMLILFFCIFVISFALFHLPVKAVLYPAVLCAVCGVAAVFVDFIKIKRKHEILAKIQSVSDVTAGFLPEVTDICESDYTEIIENLCEQISEFNALKSRNYEDMVNYYTVWAHQIKTPIAAMRLHLENEDSELSRKLRAQLLRIEQYVNMVLTYIRLNSESTDYVIKEYDLDTLVKQVVKKYSSEFIGRKLSLTYEPIDYKVVTDEKWLSFVVEQVMSNALKYTKTGGITISFEEGVLSIKDTGMGIAPEDLPRIFENGFTGYNGRIDKKASGIGLYLCKRICNNLGHGIEVQSVPDEGTCVKINLEREKIGIE